MAENGGRTLRAMAAIAVTRRARFAFSIAAALLLSLSGAAAGQDLSPCRTGSLSDLKEAMKAHNEHVYRMNRKFKDVWYFQGAVPAAVGNEVTLDAIHRYLGELAPRKAALLFHATDEDRLCTWLFTQDRTRVVQHLQRLEPKAGLDVLSPSQWQELGVRSTRKPRVADRTQPHVALDPQESKRRWNELLGFVGQMLLPPPVAQRLLDDGTDTLIVVPISIRSFRYGREEENDTSTRIRDERALRDLPPTNQLVLAVSTVPFLALPLGDVRVVNRMSVVVAPGFLPFAGSPYPVHGRITAPLLVGAPVRKGLEPLQGATEEIEQIARDLRTQPLVGAAALKQPVLDTLGQRSDALDFILFATHGRASESNPVDQSYLEFSDGSLTAREISRLRPEPAAGASADKPLQLRRRPIVVMSACETGLGKNFAVGTIGLARAWQWAGASSVVMSLWSVDDTATRDLMIDFVGALRDGLAVDKALRKAAINARRLDDNPALWAAFSVFGAPERLPMQ